jgi:hypothetical protein
VTPFIEAAQKFAAAKRRIWSGALKKQIEAIEQDEALQPDERISKATDTVLAAKKLPPLPAATQDEVLAMLETAATSFGIEPTIELRAELRVMIDNKPPPQMAHRRALEIFVKHQEMQQIRSISETMTRH